MTPEQCRAARKLLGWSQERLGHSAGLSQSAVVRFEGGGYVPGNGGADRLRAALEAAGVKLMSPDAPSAPSSALSTQSAPRS